tara:strand:+ start:383 stop:1114 length:732 start_codon:yes stop_codon:yes gene_type:complete
MINIYYSAFNHPTEDDFSWMYEEPQSLFKNKVKDKDKNRQKDMPGFDECTAFQDLGTHTLVIKNPIQTHTKFTNFYLPDRQSPVVPTSKNSIHSEILRDDTLTGQKMFDYHMPHIFFADKSVDITLTAPYFHQTKHTEYGAVVPGRYDIGSWFRPLRFEINLWEGINEWKIEENEPLAYVNFSTQEKIKLHRFHLTSKLYNIASSCAESSAWWSGVPLVKRYAKFHASNAQKKVLEEIKLNIV